MRYLLYILMLGLFLNISDLNSFPLDSIKINNNIEIKNHSKSVYTNKIKTYSSYVKLYRDSLNYTILELDSANGFYNLYREDSTFIYNIRDKNYKKFPSNFKETQNRISDLYWLIFKKELFHIDTTSKDSNLIINHKLSYDNKNSLVNFKGSVESKINKLTAVISLTVNLVNYDTLDFKFYLLESGDTIDVLTSHSTFIDASNDIEIFKSIDNFYNMNRFNYSLDTSKIQRSSYLEYKINDSLDINFDLIGISDNDSDFTNLFKENDHLAIYTWGTWCGPCISNQKLMKQFSNTFNKFPFISIIYEKRKVDKIELKEYLNRKLIEYPVYLSDDFIEVNKLNIFPAFIILNKEGIIKEIKYGTENFEDFLKQILYGFN